MIWVILLLNATSFTLMNSSVLVSGVVSPHKLTGRNEGKYPVLTFLYAGHEEVRQLLVHVFFSWCCVSVMCRIGGNVTEGSVCAGLSKKIESLDVFICSPYQIMR